MWHLIKATHCEISIAYFTRGVKRLMYSYIYIYIYIYICVCVCVCVCVATVAFDLMTYILCLKYGGTRHTHAKSLGRDTGG